MSHKCSKNDACHPHTVARKGASLLPQHKHLSATMSKTRKTTNTRPHPTDWKDAYKVLMGKVAHLEEENERRKTDLKQFEDRDRPSGENTSADKGMLNSLNGDMLTLQKTVDELTEKVMNNEKFASLEKIVAELNERTSDAKMEEWHNRKMEMIMGRKDPEQLTAAEANARNNITDEEELVSDPLYRAMADR